MDIFFNFIITFGDFYLKNNILQYFANRKKLDLLTCFLFEKFIIFSHVWKERVYILIWCLSNNNNNNMLIILCMLNIIQEKIVQFNDSHVLGVIDDILKEVAGRVSTTTTYCTKQVVHYKRLPIFLIFMIFVLISM